MATLFCQLCQRPVEAKRKFGIGTWVLVFITWGHWLLAMVFYPKRCPICKGKAFSKWTVVN